MVVAIDGPAAAGKSTVARAVARALDFGSLDTGAMYRAIALGALRGGIPVGDADALAALAGSLDLAAEEDQVLLGGSDVTEEIRSPEVTRVVSQVAAHPHVRRALVDRQRDLARGRDVVVEGRDTGTTVFPEAEVKVYLTATLEERAARRLRQLGVPVTDDALEGQKSEIARRDESDSSRSASPLARAPGATVVDTTSRTIDEVVAEVVGLVRERAR